MSPAASGLRAPPVIDVAESEPAPRADATGAARSVPGSVRASAHVVASLDRHGRPRPPQLRSGAPLVLRRTGPATVHLVSVGAGPVAGDRLELRIRVEAGAQLTVRQLAASVALPAPRGDDPSRLLLDVVVADGARLDWWGEPTVGARGCHHVTDVQLRLEGDAHLRLRDEVIAGRYREEPGRVRSRLTVVRDDRVVLRTDDTVGGPHWASAAVGGGARVSGTAVIAGSTAPEVPDVGAQEARAGLAAATFHLDDRLAVTCALGDDHPAVRRSLDAALAAGGGTLVTEPNLRRPQM